MTYNRMFAIRFEKERHQQLKKLSSEVGISMSDILRSAVALVATRPELRALLNVEKDKSSESEQ